MDNNPPENPSGNEYSPFQPELDKKFPIEDLKFNADDRSAIVGGEVSQLTWMGIFKSSPAKNSEAEILMGKVLTDSMRAGQWVDVPMPQEDGTFGEPVTITTYSGEDIVIPPVLLEFRRAAEILCKAGLTRKVNDPEFKQTYLQPTENLIKFYGERIGFQEHSEVK